MTVHEAPKPEVAHPAPHRNRTSAGMLWFGIVAAPLAWTTQVLSGAALSGHDCYPHERPLVGPIWQNVWTILLCISIAAILIAISGGAAAWRSWQQTHQELSDSAHGLLTRGEGRTRFMAMSGLLTSALFLIGLLFGITALFTVPLCGG